MSEWRPIETLNHGLGVLFWAKGFYPVCGYRDATRVMRILGTKGNYTKLSFRPTHWMPLPEPPKKS
jgi:hypothetical protein